MKRILIPFLLLIVITVTAQTTSPQVISTAGNFYSNSTASLSVTVGELTSVSTVNNPSINLTLTQGFQQNFDGTTFPVRLIEFTGTKKIVCNSINWKVVDEMDMDHYAIQRSFDGNNYSTIGIVKATNGGVSEKLYNYNDSTATKAITYYRLLMYEKSGSSSYSWVIRISSIEKPYKIYPNPVKDVLTLEVTSDQNYSREIQLFDMQGKLVWKNSYTLNVGNNIIKINLTKQLPGSYLLRGLSTDAIKIIKN